MGFRSHNCFLADRRTYYLASSASFPQAKEQKAPLHGRAVEHDPKQTLTNGVRPATICWSANRVLRPIVASPTAKAGDGVLLLSLSICGHCPSFFGSAISASVRANSSIFSEIESCRMVPRTL